MWHAELRLSAQLFKGCHTGRFARNRQPQAWIENVEFAVDGGSDQDVDLVLLRQHKHAAGNFKLPDQFQEHAGAAEGTGVTSLEECESRQRFICLFVIKDAA